MCKGIHINIYMDIIISTICIVCIDMGADMRIGLGEGIDQGHRHGQWKPLTTSAQAQARPMQGQQGGGSGGPGAHLGPWAP